VRRIAAFAILLATLAFPFALSARAQTPVLGWTVTCAPSALAYVDPIVAPGGVAAHRHQFFGNTVTADSTYESLRAGTGGTTCGQFTDDNSGYWVPILRDKNAVLAPINQGLHAYFIVRAGVDPLSIQPWPQGLKVVVGSGAASGPQPRVEWACVDFAAGRIGPKADLPQDCPDDLPQNRAKIVFPDCSNGEVDSADHLSHLAYSVAGACPETHPIPIPGLHFGIVYDLQFGEGAVLSSNLQSPRTAYGMHADFFDGWSRAEVEYLIANCIKDGTGCGSRRP
jgi:hypothetical protein